jgi:hypothetical protein
MEAPTHLEIRELCPASPPDWLSTVTLMVYPEDEPPLWTAQAGWDDMLLFGVANWLYDNVRWKIVQHERLAVLRMLMQPIKERVAARSAGADEAFQVGIVDWNLLTWNGREKGFYVLADRHNLEQLTCIPLTTISVDMWMLQATMRHQLKNLRSDHDACKTAVHEVGIAKDSLDESGLVCDKPTYDTD